MECLPLVYIERGNIIVDGLPQPAVQKLRQMHDEHDELYVVDYDGIHNNKSNLDVFKRVSRKPFLWIDAFPRRTEDIIDLVVAGAKRLTARISMGEKTLRSVREFYEGELYVTAKDERSAVQICRRLNLDGVVLMEPSSRSRDTLTWGIYPKEKIVKKIT